MGHSLGSPRQDHSNEYLRKVGLGTDPTSQTMFKFKLHLGVYIFQLVSVSEFLWYVD